MEEMDMIDDGEEAEERDERGEMMRGNKRIRTRIDEYARKEQYSSNQNAIPLPLPRSLPFPLPLPSPVSTSTPTHTPSSTHTPIPPLPSTPSLSHEDTADRFRGIVFFDGLGDIVDVQAPLLKFQVIFHIISAFIRMILLSSPYIDLLFIPFSNSFFSFVLL